MRRMIDLSVGALALILLAAHCASAAGPARDPSTAPPGLVIDPGAVCDFPVQLEILVNKEYTLTFPADAHGITRQLVNGKLVVLITNLATHASVTRNISGPGEYLFYPDGSNTLTAEGAWALWFLADQRGEGTPSAFFINRGRFVQHTGPGPDFLASVLNQSGTQEDLCATLGG